MKTIITFLLLAGCILLNSYSGFAVNSVSQTLSKLDLETEAINNSFAVLGEAALASPNKVAFYNEYAMVVVTYENCVRKIHTGTGAVENIIYLEDSSSPNDLLVKDDAMYVTSNTLNKVYKINLTDNSVVDTVNVGRSPEGLAVSDTLLFVANTGFISMVEPYRPGLISVISTNSFEEVRTISTSVNPRCFAIVDNYLHVVCSGDYSAINPGCVNVINLANDELVQTINISGSPSSICHGMDNKMYLGGYPAGIHIYDAETYRIISTPTDNTFTGGSFVTTSHEYVVVGDAVDYVENSKLRLYNIGDYSYVGEYSAGVGITDFKFYDNPVLVSPQNLTAVTGADSVVLSWDYSATALVPQTYRVFSQDELVGEVEGNITTYTINDLAAGDHSFEVQAKYLSTYTDFSNICSITVSGTGIAEHHPKANSTISLNCYPNPFNPATNVAFSLNKEQYCEVKVYNTKGQQVATLFSGVKAKGNHVIRWNGKNTANCASGVYFVRVKTADASLVKKVLMMK